LPELPNPFRALSSSADPTSGQQNFLFDGSDAALLQQAQRVIQSDFGVNDPFLLDDEDFVFIGPNLEIPLSKTDYLAAARFFNLRNAFPDLDYRAHDFRIDQNTVRCTARVTGTMRGELRLRTAVLAPTGLVLRCPPEAISLTLDRRTGRVTKLGTGFVLDRFVGNTRGLAGVQAASIIAGEEISVWDLFPPAAVLGNVFARPVQPVPETTTFLAPFPETVMIQLAKGVFAAQMGANDPTLLSDDEFTYCTPTVGPIRKAAFIEQYARAELQSFTDPGASNWRIDPYDPVRVWVDLSPTAPGYVGPPQAMSFTFDEDGYCTRITAQAVMDPSIGNAGGLGGPDGVLYARGQARPGIFTRPLPRSLERWRLRLLSPITGTSVDTFLLPPKKCSFPWETSSTPSPLTKTAFQPKAPAKTALTPKPPAARPLTPRERASKGGSVTPPKSPSQTESPAMDSAVVKRLEQLKEFTTSIRIIPPNTATPTNDRLAASRKAAQNAKVAMAKAQREAQLLQQQLAAEERKAQAAALAAEKAKELARKQQLQAAQKDAEAKELARQQQQQAVQKAEKAKAIALQQQLQAAQKEAKAKEIARQQQLQAAQKAEKAKEIARQQQQAEQEKATAARRQQAQRDAEIQRQELEAQRMAAAAASETRKVQAMKEQLEQKRRLTTVMKANRAAQAASSSPRSPSRSVYKISADATDGSGAALGGLARATISLFGLGKAELEDLPAAAATSTKVARAPVGVPTITRWRVNADQTITGLVKGSRIFDDGARITTSPITSGNLQSGAVVRTGSGSRYFLE
jgi:hypothetical protein